tara:strand:+ start:4876 stop:5415 length:540 start_codon:yes stop_codon:yes gene_type:complete
LKSIFNIPNILSISRIIASIPLVYFLININIPNYTFYSIVVVFFIVISDVMDGYIARKNKETTDFGKVIDPVADKVCLMVVLTYLIALNQLPFLIFFILLSIRDVVLLAFSLYFLIYTKYVPQAIFEGKLFIFVTSLMIIFNIYTINEIVSVILYYISIFLLLYSMFVYIKRHLIKINS